MYRKFISILTLITFLWCLPVGDRQAHAVVAPAILGAAAVGALLFAGGSAYYYKPATAGSSDTVLSSVGNIGRKSVAVYATIGKYEVADLYSKFVAAKVYWADLADRLMNPDASTKYPLLKAAMSHASGVVPLNQNSKLNDIVLLPSGSYFKITSKEVYGPGICAAAGDGSSSEYWDYGDSFAANYYYGTNTTACPGGFTTEAHFYGVKVAPPPPRQATKEEFTQTVTGNIYVLPPYAPALDSYRGEIDDFIKNEPNIVHWVDTATPDQDNDTAPPYAPPVGAMNPADSSAVKPATTTAAGSAAQTAAQTAAATASQFLADASKALNDYKAAHPDATIYNDPQLKTLTDTYSRALAANDAAVNQLAEADTASQTPLADPEQEAPKRINWDRLKDLLGVLGTKFPFTLLAMIPALLTPLVSDPVAPVFEFPMPLGNTLTIDLAIFDPVASVSRWVMAIGLTIGIIIIVYRRFTD